MRFRLASLVGVAVLASVASASAQTATLRYRWTKGDVVAYRITQQNTSTMSGMPGMGDMVVEQTVEQGFHLTVDDVAADGTATLRQTFDSMRMTMNSPAGTIAFDSTSAAKTDDPLTAAVAVPLRAMIGESITLVMQPTGKVVKLEGMSRIFEKVMGGMSNNPIAAQMLEQLKTGMGDDAMRMTFQQGFGSFPDHAVKVGETWTDKLETTHPLLGATTATATSTLTSVEAGTSVAHLALKTAMTYAATGAPTGPMNMVVKATNSTSEGETLFDTAKGRIQKTTVKSEIPMTMSMQGPDGSPVNIQSVNKTTMTVEAIEKK